MWRSQFESAQNSRDLHEKDHLDSKHTYHSTKIKLQAATDHMSGQSSSLEDEIKNMVQELSDFRRAAATRETENSTRQAAAEHKLRDSQEQVQDVRVRFRELNEQHARVGGEAAGTRERMLELHMALERNLDSQSKAYDAERRRMNDQLESQRRMSEQVRDEFSREREMTSEQLKHVHDESRKKLAGASREHQRIQETSRSEVSQMNQMIVAQQHQLKVLEHDHARIQSLLSESESNTHIVRQEQDHHINTTHVSMR
jgi:hypothetical protein